MHSFTLSNGCSVPLMGFGTWKLDPSLTESVIKEAIDAGYRHIDCAMIYQNEDAIGRGLKARLGHGGNLKREDLFITSKLWNTFHRPEMVVEGCRKTLSDLQLDYLDLYLMHWPVAYQPGNELFPKAADGSLLYDTVPVEATWKAMEELVRLGLTKAIGLSNFNKSQIERIMACAQIKPAMLQIESHVGFLNQKLINFARSVGMSVTAYCPLGSPREESPHDNLLNLPVVQQLSKKHGKTPGQILLRHGIQRELCVIPKSANANRIRENIAIFDFELDSGDMLALNTEIPQVRRVRPDLMVNHPEFPFKTD